jgi:hypothetical protein
MDGRIKRGACREDPNARLPGVLRRFLPRMATKQTTCTRQGPQALHHDPMSWAASEWNVIKMGEGDWSKHRENMAVFVLWRKAWRV